MTETWLIWIHDRCNCEFFFTGDVLRLLMLTIICSQIGRVFSRSFKFGQISMPQKRPASFTLEGRDKRAAKMFVSDVEEKIDVSDEQKTTVQFLGTPDKSDSDKKSYR